MLQTCFSNKNITKAFLDLLAAAIYFAKHNS